MAELDFRENIDCMITVMSDLDLHLIATAGYLRTGATNALNGDQDHEIKSEAAVFWKDGYENGRQRRGSGHEAEM